MPLSHSYEKIRNSSDELAYAKQHDNGETTTVSAVKLGPSTQGGANWSVKVDDPNGQPSLGTFGSKSDARQAMTRWMNNHPKGVQGPRGAMGAVKSMEDATNSIFTGGGRF